MRNYITTKAGVLIAFLLLALALAGCAAKGKVAEAEVADIQEATVPPPQVLTTEQEELKQILGKNGYSGKGVQPCILLVRKQSRKLVVYKGLTPVKTYPVVLGANPKADKLCQGDMCTPEGVYRVVTKFEHDRWSRFILLDYPNTQNWIKFARAKETGQVPLEADIGGEIGIHGTEDDLKNLNGENWTRGCVSLRNRDVEEIYPLVNAATLVVIKRR